MSEVAKRLYQLNESRPRTLGALEAAIISTLRGIKENDPHRRIILVSGRVTMPDAAEPARARRGNETFLRGERRRLQLLSDLFFHNRFYFTSADLMPPIREVVMATHPTGEQFFAMWDNIVSSGYVDGLYMTRDSHLSTGARREHEAAKRVGIPIEYHSLQLRRAFA